MTMPVWHLAASRLCRGTAACDGRRALGEALQTVGKTDVEDATAFLAECVHFR
jgi:hypothetical protein